MDIFSLVGKITVSYTEAVNGIERVSRSAGDAAEELSKIDSSAEKSEKSAKNLGKSTEDAGNKAENAGKHYRNHNQALNTTGSMIDKLTDKCGEIADAVSKSGNETEKSGSRIVGAFKKIGSTIVSAFKHEPIKKVQTSLTDLTDTVSKQENDLADLKRKYQDLYLTHGKNSTEAKKCADEIKKLSSNLQENKTKLSEAESAADKFDTTIQDAGKAAESADSGFSTWKVTLANLVSNVITKAVSGCAQLAQSVVGLGSEFTSTMSEVQAISGASDEQMQQLESTAREFGATTVFSANDAAEALKYMSLAGWSVEESTSALGGVLDLAAASGMELGQASDMVTDYLSAFGMEADQAAYFADMLASAQANSNTTAEQLGEAYRNCAANLNAAGQDVETTTSLLEAMANQGYKGSEAGTALTAIVRDMTNAMKDGNIQIGDTSVSVMDAQGNFRDLTDILTDVQNATNGMGDAQRATALSTTFTADSTKGLNLLLNEGMENVAGYEDALRSSNGAASDMAATMNDNLKGDIANLNSAFEELKLKIFDGAEAPMRKIVQFATNKVIPGITKLINNVDKVKTVLTTLAPAIALVTTVLGTMAVAFQIQRTISGVTNAVRGLFLVMAVNPIVAIIALIAGFVAMLVTAWNTSETFRNVVTSVWNGIKNTVGSVIDGIVGFFTGLADTAQNVWDSITEAVSTAIEAIKGFFTGLVDSIKQAWENIKTAISEKINVIKETVSNAFNSLVDTVSEIWDTIKNVVTVGIMLIGSIIDAAVQIITLPWQFIWENCKEYIISAWEFIKTVISSALDIISSAISNAWDNIVGFLTPILEGIKNTFATVWESIKTIISTEISIIQTIITTVWNTISTVISTVLNTISNVVSAGWNTIKSVISTALHGIRSVVTTVWNAISNTVSNVMGTIRNTMSTAWNFVKATVSGAISNVKSTISNGLYSARSTVSNVLNSISSTFSNIWNTCKNTVSGAINHIKSLMNFSWSLPSLKLPHFSVSGKFSLNPPSVPKLGVEWYKKAMDDGMILNQPTIFGYNAKSNQFLAGGEAGSETVVGTQNLMDMIQEAVNNAGSGDGDSEATRALLEAIFNWMRNGGLYKLLIDVLTNGVEFEFDNREIARLVKKYA